MQPEWIMAAGMVASQIATAVGVVVAIRGDVRRVEVVAYRAQVGADKAHERIDTIYSNQGGTHATQAPSAPP
jgi:hypothetical protein